MNKILFPTLFLLGALTILWIGAGFVGSHLLALAVTIVIAAVYTLGALEMRQFRQATSTLSVALDSVPETLSRLEEWLDRLHPSLQNSVRLRIEGERINLPGPSLTPYLVGLLVMLGMLGTFLGMVATLNGAVFALESTPDLQAIRSGLAAPIKGLGLAFGTSVAGVAASAMLGLISTLSLRERLQTVQRLDTKIATVFRHFSLAYQRQETYKALQQQALSLPHVVDRLQALTTHIERMSDQINERLTTNQANFHASVQTVYTELAQSVENSLKASLAEGGRMAGESIKPIVDGAMNRIAQEAQDTHATLASLVNTQLDGLSVRFSDTASAVANTWRDALTNHEHSNQNLIGGLRNSLESFNQQFASTSTSLLTSFNDTSGRLLTTSAANDQQRLSTWIESLTDMSAKLSREWQQAGQDTLAQQQDICAIFETSVREISQNTQASAEKTLNEVAKLLSASEDLIRSRMASEEIWAKEHGERIGLLATMLRDELGTLRNDEAARGSAAVERLGELQSAVATHLTTLGTALEAPMTRLIETASETPRAAAEVIGQLRQEISNNLVRDNALLDERNRIMQGLDAVLVSLSKATVEQRAAIDALVNSSTEKLDSVGTKFSNHIEEETSKLAEAAAQVTGSSVEVSSLSEAFGFAVQLFSASNDKLIESLARIEAAMDKSTTRSDEQLAYYVAQAREIIDLSMMSQKETIEELRNVSSQKISEVETN